MQRYFLLKDEQTLEVYVSMPMDHAPENSIAVEPNQQYNFFKAKFDQYPNPTAIVEGITIEELEHQRDVKIAEVKAECRRKLLPTDWYVIRKLERGVEVPEDISAQRQVFLDDCNDRVAELENQIITFRAAQNQTNTKK